MTFGELRVGALFQFREGAPLYMKVSTTIAKHYASGLTTNVAAHSQILPLTDETDRGTV